MINHPRTCLGKCTLPQTATCGDGLGLDTHSKQAWIACNDASHGWHWRINLCIILVLLQLSHAVTYMQWALHDKYAVIFIGG